MSILRLWVIGAVLMSLIIVSAGWFLGVAPRLADAALAQEERQNVEVINVGYEATLAELQRLSENLPELESELESLRVEIPDEPELSTLLGQLNTLAEAAGVSIVEVTARTPVLFPPDQLDGTGVTDLVALPVTIRAAGEGPAIDAFIRQVQFGPRLILVEQFDLTDDPVAGAVSLEALIFVLPAEGAALPTEQVGEQPLEETETEE
ncbi:type 4a pilus biogenesis protein PilO [Microcella alkaliphila]|uniref:Type IV pilus biogenesis protein PilO n=1 Tax=Microcella alkaliphila TaxID=279828 RepID=A0A0U4WU02_9MICO|nr:type 4a pilus biogenesis protein PilO [Microcella alkaliphila]BAU31352.1 type IV pilus biogenesis protein PilO [Microcella alkaliphila]